MAGVILRVTDLETSIKSGWRAVRVTSKSPDSRGVPYISPVVELHDRPLGRSLAEKEIASKFAAMV